MITIYHNPACSNSRDTLGLIRNSGNEPRIIEYLKTPPPRAELMVLLKLMGMTARRLLREQEAAYRELDLGRPELDEDVLLDAMIAHPILINRPIVVTPLGVKLCRPPEAVLDILIERQRGAFTKENGGQVVDEHGNRIVPQGCEPSPSGTRFQPLRPD